MDNFSHAKLRELLDSSPRAGVSLFLPTHRLGSESQQDRIRIKNLAGRAEDLLRGRGLSSAESVAILSPALELVDDTQFWQHQSDGLALFMAEGFMRRYRLPIKFAEYVQVAPRFYIKPLLPMLTEDGHYFVLALSLKEARLLAGTRDSMDEFTLSDMPAGISRMERGTGERSLQSHSSSGGHGGAIFHGQGATGEEDDAQLKQYFRDVDRAVAGRLRGERAPLVLAAVESHLPIYREVSSYSPLLANAVGGNPDELSALDLRARSWSLVKPHFAKTMMSARERLDNQLGTGHASAQLGVVVPAAHNGRIEFLFVATGVQQWGRFQDNAAEITLHDTLQENSQDLTDIACALTLKHGGVVYALPQEQMPGKSMIAAGFRF
jgi:hypothetical protein